MLHRPAPRLGAVLALALGVAATAPAATVDFDLYVAVDHGSDEFYRNDGGGFTLATATVGATHEGNDMGVSCADFDHDSDLDCFATNITDPDGNFGTTQGNVLYENRLVPDGSLGFVDAAAAAGVFDTAWGWGTEFLDAENDGDLDLVAVTGFDEFVLATIGAGSAVYETPSVLFLNDGLGGFAATSGTDLDLPDDSRALAAFDYDRDGDLDLLITNREQPVRLLENRSTGQGSWLTVRLAPDRAAIGATLRATAGGLTHRRDVIAGRSYLVGTPPEVSFGLGGAAQVDRLEVEWADGSVDTLTDVPVDQVLDLHFAAPAAPSLSLPFCALLVGLLTAAGRRAGSARRSRRAPLRTQA